jgi:hypothetical protein
VFWKIAARQFHARLNAETPDEYLDEVPPLAV